MSWNFRIMKHVDKNPLYEKSPHIFQEFETWYGIHEVYYHEDNKKSYTKDPIDLTASTPEELHGMFKMIGDAFFKDILDYENEKNT